MIGKMISVSTEYTGNTTLPANPRRKYFFITFTEGEGTLNFGRGTGEIPIKQGGSYSPTPTPVDEITITTTGTFVVHVG